MHTRGAIFVGTTLAVVLMSAACTGGLQPTPAPTSTPESTPTPLPQAISVAGPDCPKSFREQQELHRDVTIAANSSLTLTVGSTPSIPCGWQRPAIGNQAIVRQVDHQSKWPAEGATPMPGAPGTEIWGFETREAGETTITLTCTCLGEEGSGEEVRGTFNLHVTVER